jgi:hypothetical protein
MKNKSSNRTLKIKGGNCNCGSGKPLFQNGGCVSCNTSLHGGGFNISPTSQASYYPLNDVQHDPTMLGISTRIQGVPVSNTLNGTGSNNIMLGGKKSKSKLNNKTKKNKLKKKKKTDKKKQKSYKKQKGGINLGYISQNSLLGHGHYGTWFGAPSLETPDWNKSIFTTPASLNTTGYSKFNSYLV